MLGIIASVLFGTAVREFDDIYLGLYHSLGFEYPDPTSIIRVVFPTVLAMLMYAVYFRNIHGFYAFNALEGRDQKFTKGAEILSVITLPLSVLVLPYVGLHRMAKGIAQIEATPRVWIPLMWIAFFLQYFVWDVFVWLRVQPTDAHGVEFHARVSRWICCDGVSALGLLLLILYDSYNKTRAVATTQIAVYAMFALTAAVVLSYDYYSNRNFYFKL
jgi:hypothetical protein